jgi:hypothetical protein
MSSFILNKEHINIEDYTKNIDLSINYHKSKCIDITCLENNWKEDLSNVKHLIYEPFKINNLQQYNPLYSIFFELSKKNYDSISLNHKYIIKDLKNISDIKTDLVHEKNVFVKFSPLIDPIRYMAGKYGLSNDIIQLPIYSDSSHDETCNSDGKTVQSKIYSIYNASYIDCFFYYISSVLLNNYNFLHGIDFYGSYLGIQDNFKINIEEDIEYLENFDFFNANIDNLFFIDNWNKNDGCYMNKTDVSRGNKKKIHVYSEKNIAEDVICEYEKDIIDCSLIPEYNEITEVYSNTNHKNMSLGSKSNDSSDYEQSSEDETINSDEDDENMDLKEDELEEEWEDISNDEEQSEDNDKENTDNETHAYIKNFPIQMICMEKCDGTLDDLFMNDMINEEVGLSALFQIIMTLIVYQNTFHFTHNDLHTNNIAYVNTDKTHLYYKFKGITYCVPTYGRIFKIIDFGRSIYKFQNKVFCSDSFSQYGDANTQYNFPPFYNEKKPIVLPNYSFDLCRLGCSIYDFIIEDNCYKPSLKKMNKFQRIIYDWCLDDKGQNILYTKTGEERYPGFKLYKAIARKVTQHTPENQLSNPIFNDFIMKT